MRLKNKIAILTGATGGIGEATANSFVSEGGKIAVVDIQKEKVERLVSEIGQDKALALAGDVTDIDSVKDCVDRTISHYGQLDIAFLNAGIEGEVAKITEYPLESFKKVMAVNVTGVFLGLKSVIPPMQKNGGGSIIITSSLGGLRGQSKLAPYIASKHAVVGLMKSASVDYAVDKIRVNTINPGPIATRMIKSLEEGYAPGSAEIMKNKMERAVPLRRYGQPEEVAELALFLASDEASFITGNCYPVDGGINAI